MSITTDNAILNNSISIHILIVEDNGDDVTLLLRELKKLPMPFTHSVVYTKENFLQSINSIKPDIILSDYSLPEFDGLSAFDLKHKIYPEIPFLVISGVIGEEKAVELIKNGITDYVLKDKIFSLVPKISRALKDSLDKKEKIISDEKLTSQSLRLMETNFLRQIMETSQEGIWLLNEENRTSYVNDKLCNLLGYNADEMMGKDIYFFMDDEGKKIATSGKDETVQGINNNHEYKYITKTGKDVWAKVSANKMYDESGIYKGSLGMISNITEKRYLAELLDKATKWLVLEVMR